MKLKSSKKGFIQLVLALPVLIAIIILVVLLVGFLVLSGWFLAKNIFLLAGLFLIIMGSLGFIKGFPFQAGVTLIVIGIFVLLLPVLFNKLAGITLASILP